jgi:hypothetical protein
MYQEQRVQEAAVAQGRLILPVDPLFILIPNKRVHPIHGVPLVFWAESNEFKRKEECNDGNKEKESKES